MRTILLDNIRSLLNVGAIFRTADGAGFSRVYLAGYTPTPPRHEITKTAIGAEDAVIWEYYEDPLAILVPFRQRGGIVVALEQSPESIDYRAYSPPIDCDICLVVGNEIGGVRPEILQIADTVIHIPMLGVKQSLNVATAAGIAMYSILEHSDA